MSIIFLGLVGLVFGSFAGAQVWRLRAQQLVEDKKAGEPYDKQEYKALIGLTNSKLKDDRSRCLSCGHVLHWYDLFPLFSWLSTGGRCRYCHKPIGKFEPLIELGMAGYFVLSLVFWPAPFASGYEVAQFLLWLIAGVLLVILFAYDAKWFLLPDRLIFPLIAVATLYAGIEVFQDPDKVGALLTVGGSIAILSGIYFVLWLVSKGKWIGFGDVKLGIALGLLLGRWELAFLALFLANLIGCLIVLPGLLAGKISRTTHIPFGPMLIAGFFITALWGTFILDWYVSTTTTLML